MHLEKKTLEADLTQPKEGMEQDFLEVIEQRHYDLHQLITRVANGDFGIVG